MGFSEVKSKKLKCIGSRWKLSCTFVEISGLEAGTTQ